MKLKEIKPGMVIGWKTEDEKAALLEELERLGYVWYGIKRKPTGAYNYEYIGKVIHVHNDNGYKNITHSNKLEKVTHEFSDLIIPELELSAEEALMLRGTICEAKNCGYCPLAKSNNGEGEICNKFLKNHPGKAVELLDKWKSDHENKEPEIEWFWKSHVVGGSDYKEADTEQEAMEWCEYYVKEHPEAKCIYKRVCRVKAVE